MPSHSPSSRPPGFDSSIPPADRYNIVGRIAAGGMAEIYLAKMAGMAGIEREVVLKRLLPELQIDDEFVQMFYDEAQIASQLSHPNVVQIYELGELDESLFISMELLRGVNLRDLLARLHHDSRKIPVEIACRICCGALEGLAYAHDYRDESGRRLNIIHRDVSPQNIIVTYDGTVKLLDFGVAKAEGKLHQTRAGLVKGKFAYMSPEQVNGSKLDGRSDLFALSEIFYELLLHRHPFFAESDMEVLRLILDGQAPHPTALDQAFPPGLADILLKGLKKDPDHRFSNAQNFQEAVENFLVEHRSPATTVSVGRFVRELFSDRMALEQKARERKDQDLLIKAMTVGRAERWEMTGSALPSNSQMMAFSGPQDEAEAEAERADSSTLRGEADDAYEDDFTDDTEVTLAHAETPVPQNVAVAAAASRQAKPMGSAVVEETEDPTEAPTMMGKFSAEEIDDIRPAEIAKTAAQRFMIKPRAGPAEPNAEDDPSVKIRPITGDRKGPIVSRSSHAPPDPAAQSGRGKKQIATKSISPELGRKIVSETSPTKAGSPTPSREAARPKTKQSSRSKDQLGIWLFVLGLGALIGALAYAGILIFTGTTAIHLIVRSEPKGAQIWVDGFNTGFTTPKKISELSADRTHRVELKHPGFKTYVRVIKPDPENRGEPYVINKVLDPFRPPTLKAKPKPAKSKTPNAKK